MRLLFLTIILFTINGLLKAQFYNSGQDASNLKWKTIENENFKIVFPEQSDSIAQYLASALSWSYENITQDMHHKPRKIGVIIHAEASTSNGSVVWAPRRIEIFTTPPMDNYPHDWFEQLSIHEYRHVIQVDKLNQGLTKYLYYLFGEQIVGGVLGLYIPLWFLEGDAVWAETKYSLTGRGRQWSFSDPLRVQVMQKEIYSYDKATMGSYRDFVPDHYILGYNIVNEVRRQYGDEVWPNTLNYVARNPYMIIPFSRSLKLNTGLRKKALYENVMDSLKLSWEKSVSVKADFLDKMSFITQAKGDYEDYGFPAQMADSVFVAIKRTLNHIPQIVTIDQRGGEIQEKKILSLGYSEFYNVSYADSLICWEEIRFDPRWNHRRFHVIMTYDFRTSKAHELTKNSRYYAPELSVDAKKIVCFEISSNNVYALVILDSKTGEILSRYSFPFTISTPVWSNDNQEIYFVQHSTKGHNISKIELSDGEISQITEPDYYTKSIEWVGEDAVFFTAEYQGANNLYSIEIGSKKLVKITDAPHTTKNAFKNSNGDLLYCYTTAYGNKIVKTKLSEIKPELISISSNFNNNLFAYDGNGSNIQTQGFKLGYIESKPYRKIAHLFNFHSWGILGVSGTTLDANPGIYLSSQNLLGTAEFGLSYYFSRNFSTSNKSLNFKYTGFYPEINLNYTHIYLPDNSGQHIYLDLLTSSFSVPLNLTRRLFLNGIEPFFAFRYQDFTQIKTVDVNLRGYDLIYGFSFRSYKRMVEKDIRPRFGFTGDLTLASTFSNNNLIAYNVYGYLPGILKHHSFRFYLGNQINNNLFLALSYGDKISMPRGFLNLTAKEMYSLKLDYAFPILYPDKSLGSIFYFKRLRMNLFYDYGRLADDLNSYSADFNSYGVDVILDGHFFRFISASNIGLRSIFHRNGRSFEFIFGMDLP